MTTTPNEPVSDDVVGRIENEEWAQHHPETPDRDSEDEDAAQSESGHQGMPASTPPPS